MKTEGDLMKEALLYESLDHERVECRLCSHFCRISPGAYGICGVRRNAGGRLETLTYGRPLIQGVDPVEKKPLYHFLPGSAVYSIATPGCNFRCSFCQNWRISQVKRGNVPWDTSDYSPSETVGLAMENACKSIAFTYTEPTVFYELAMDISEIARSRGVRTVMVSNGFMSGKALETLLPMTDAFNIDLKSFSEDFYRTVCGARLGPVLDNLRAIKKSGSWLEITTLVIPGMNDSEDELDRAAEFIAEIGSDTPWHISRFFPNFKLQDIKPTPQESLDRALRAAGRHGLEFVYTGNTGRNNETRCNSCKRILIERVGYSVRSSIGENGSCPGCGNRIPGIWK